VREQYCAVATDPGRGFHFHTGRPLAAILEYRKEWLAGLPEASIESFAGTGNPFRAAPPRAGDCIVDVGCGAGLDSLIAARLGGPDSLVIGVDMTAEMIRKARASAKTAGLANVEFRQGYGEELPVEDGCADLVISNASQLLTIPPGRREKSMRSKKIF
jgi:SAM-dependent methyltransferase